MIRLLCAATLLFLPSCSLLVTSRETTPHPQLALRHHENTTPMLVFSHGYHTGLALPNSALRSHLPELCEGLTDEWLEFGWGDEAFYRSETATAKLVFSALFYPTPGAVHVAEVKPPFEHYYHSFPIRIIEMNPEQTAQVAEFLATSFKRDEQGRLLDLGPGRYDQSRFYRAKNRYFFPRSCNSWTAKGIRAAGHQVHAVTAPGVMRQLPPPVR